MTDDADCIYCGDPIMCTWEMDTFGDDQCHDCGRETECAACGYPAEGYSEVELILDRLWSA